MRVLVAGAAGIVGERLVPELVAHGHEVVALVPDADRYDPPAVGAGRVGVVEGNLLDAGSVEAALEDVRAVYYLGHSLRGDAVTRDRRAAIAVRDAADAAGVRRVVFLGRIGADRADREDGPEHLYAGREVEVALRSGDYELTVLRAGVVIGAGCVGFEVARQLADRLPVMVFPRWVRSLVQPIAVDDLVAYLAGVLAAPETAGETYDVGGPDVLTYGDVLLRTGRLATGREPVHVSVPVLAPGLSARWIGLVTDVPVAVARPLVRELCDDAIVQDYRIDDQVGVDLTPFDEAVRGALADDGRSRRGP